MSTSEDDQSLTRHDDVEHDVLAWAEDGRFLITGEAGAVDRFVAELMPRRQLRTPALSSIADGLALAAVAAKAAKGVQRYVEVDPKQWQALVRTGIREADGRLLPVIREGAQFKELIRLKPDSITMVGGMTPQTMMVMAALRLAIEETTAIVEEVAEDVDDLKRVAEAAEIGNLAGLYRVLANAQEQVDRSGSITRTTWEAIAPHEVTAQQAADRLRALLRRTVEDLPLTKGPADRYDAIRRLQQEGTIRRTLKLLVLAEQCRLLWRALKLEQTRRAEPEAVESEALAAKELLAANAQADQQLIRILQDGITALGSVGPLDGVRLFMRGRLPAAAAELRRETDEFATQRAQQLDSWAPSAPPTVKDAVREVGARAEQVALEGRRVLGDVLIGLGGRLQGGVQEKDVENIAPLPPEGDVADRR